MISTFFNSGTRSFLFIIMKRYGKKSSESPPRIRALIVKPDSDHLKHTKLLLEIFVRSDNSDTIYD